MDNIENVELRFKYLFDDRYDPDYVNGFYGGINPTGEIVVHFFLERSPLPNEEKITFTPGETPSEESSVVDPEEFKYIRSVKSGIVINKELASTLAQWLQSLISDSDSEESEEGHG